jgi:hypothetical protein
MENWQGLDFLDAQAPVFLFLAWFLRQESCSIAQAGLELRIFLSQLPEYLDYRHSPSCPTVSFYFNNPIHSFSLSRTREMSAPSINRKYPSLKIIFNSMYMEF